MVTLETKDVGVAYVGDVTEGLHSQGHLTLHLFAGYSIDREDNQAIFGRHLDKIE